MTAPRCIACRHWEPAAGRVEQDVAGLTTFSSAYGASIGDSRLCRLHDCLVSPRDRCRDFAPGAPARSGQAVADANLVPSDKKARFVV